MAAAGEQHTELLVVQFIVGRLIPSAQLGERELQSCALPMMVQPVLICDRRPVRSQRHGRHGSDLQAQYFGCISDQLVGAVGERGHDMERGSECRPQPLQNGVYSCTNRILRFRCNIAMPGDPDHDRVGRQIGCHHISAGDETGLRVGLHEFLKKRNRAFSAALGRERSHPSPQN